MMEASKRLPEEANMELAVAQVQCTVLLQCR